jgi:hypothetical protein
MVAPGARSRNSRALRLESLEPASMRALAPSRLSAFKMPTTAGSSPTRVNSPATSSVSAINRRLSGVTELATMSRISRPSRDSEPMSATVIIARLPAQGLAAAGGAGGGEYCRRPG